MEKIKSVLQSRKFWALVASLVGLGCGIYSGALTPVQAAPLAVAALAAYSIGTGIEDSAPPTPPAAPAA